MTETTVGNHAAPDRVHLGYLVILAGVAFLGFFLNVQILNGYGGTMSEWMSGSWFCGDQQGLDYGCGGVFASRYGRPGGVPLPVFGAVYFGMAALWVPVFRRKSLNPLFALLLAGGAAVSLVLLAILLFVLPGQCRWCLMVHVTNGAMIALGLVGFVRYGGLLNFREFGLALTRAILVTLAMLALTGWLAAMVFKSQVNKLVNVYENVRLSECYQRGLYSSQKARMIPILPDDHILGRRSAPVKVVVYKDYQCPHCRGAWRVFQDVYDRVNANGQNNMMVVLRHYPLSRWCNPNVKSDVHPFACPAARAAEAAYLVGGEEAFWKYNRILSDLLNRDPEALDEGPYVALAEQMGLSRQSFLKALTDPKVQAKIRQDADSMRTLGVPQVIPTVFINGRYLDWGAWRVKGFLEQLVREELKPVTTPRPVKAAQ